MMSDFKTVYPNLVDLDPGKRVNYSYGQVLGVQEFQQEQLYWLEKHRVHQSLLHGYGTVCGLPVLLENDDGVPVVKVGPGAAVDPLGRDISIPLTQCARLNDWLSREDIRTGLDARLFGSPPLLSVYVILCYRECLEDIVPIPGGPCQSVEESSAPSRIRDGFELNLSLTPPQQREELAVRLLAALFARFDLDDSGDALTEGQVEDLLRALPELLEQLAADPGDFEITLSTRIEQALDQLIEGHLLNVSPPVTASPPDLRLPLHPGEARQILDAAMLVWVTEVRPRVHAGACARQTVDPDAQCLLLARLQFSIEQINSSYRVAGDLEDWVIDQSERPYLLHGRLVQELRGKRP